MFIATSTSRRCCLRASSRHLQFLSSSAATGPVTAAYQEHISTGKIRHDSEQVAVASKLDALHNSLLASDTKVLPSHQLYVNYDPALPLHRRDDHISARIEHAQALAVHRIKMTLSKAIQPTPPRGIYVHGTVGVGKSYLMDLFHDACSSSNATLQRKSRRAHFHEFMLDVHDRIHRFRKDNPGAAAADPIPPLALGLAQEARVLCFDEFQVTDIADAMIIKRLFTLLFDVGVVVVATSNRHPDALYEGGLNRSLFLPFIDTLKRTCDVVEMGGAHDYRRDKATSTEESSLHQSYFSPAQSSNTKQALEEIFRKGGGEQRSTTVPVMMGRTVHVSRANDTCGWLDFMELCHKPLGAADYLALCNRFPVLIIDNVPQLGASHFNEARRFVTLIDAMYESKTRLVIAADVPMEELLLGFDATLETNDGDEEVAVQGLRGGESAIQNQRGDEEMWVNGEGGSSSSSSTTMIRTRNGGVEWSATGRIGVSLAQLSAVRDVAFSFKRAESRLAEMSGDGWSLERS